jgi:hypothetical protein
MGRIFKLVLGEFTAQEMKNFPPIFLFKEDGFSFQTGTGFEPICTSHPFLIIPSEAYTKRLFYIKFTITLIDKKAKTFNSMKHDPSSFDFSNSRL